jgi:hypothetical protein
MKWIVLKENPQADNYIAVVPADKMKNLKIKRKAYSEFDDADEALHHARELKRLHKVREIKIFRL